VTGVATNCVPEIGMCLPERINARAQKYSLAARIIRKAGTTSALQCVWFLLRYDMWISIFSRGSDSWVRSNSKMMISKGRSKRLGEESALVKL
jgi:hypothetical protein